MDTLPPELANHPIFKMMSSLLNTGADEGLKELFTKLGAMSTAARGEANSASTALQTAQAAPAPEPNQALAAMMTSLGGAASGLGQSNAPAETAAKITADERAQLLQNRVENLSRLTDAYKRAADRAERIGDMETEIKMRTQMEKVSENHQLARDMLGKVTDDTLTRRRESESFAREKTLKIGLATSDAMATLQRQQLGDEAAERRSWIAQGIDPDTKKSFASDKYRGRTNSAIKWSTLNQMSDDYTKVIEQSTKRGLTGQSISRGEMISKIIGGGIAPPEEWRNSPERYARYIASLPDPTKPGELLFKVDSKTGKSIHDKRIQELVRRYYPDVEF